MLSRRQERKVLRKKNVVGVGIARKVVAGRDTDEMCVVVFVERKVPVDELRRRDVIPKAVKSVKTDVVETGRIVALQSRTSRIRPAPGGVSIGHYRITAGTLGVVVRRGGVRHVLSNNHVLANENRAQPGDAILQPGPYDGGTQADRIAGLTAFVPIYFDGFWAWLLGLFGLAPPARNIVDAAIARPMADADVSDEVLQIGLVSGTALATLGMAVQKSGRTTGLTSGRIVAVAATISVWYGYKLARFRDQVVTDAKSDGGDSGSLIVDMTNRAVGLLFAGSTNTTILNPIEHVKSLLGVDI